MATNALLRWPGFPPSCLTTSPPSGEGGAHERPGEAPDRATRRGNRSSAAHGPVGGQGSGTHDPALHGSRYRRRRIPPRVPGRFRLSPPQPASERAVLRGREDLSPGGFSRGTHQRGRLAHHLPRHAEALMGRPPGPLPYKAQPPDEALHEYATEKEWDYYLAYRELGTHDLAAAKCNVTRRAVGEALARLFSREIGRAS